MSQRDLHQYVLVFFISFAAFLFALFVINKIGEWLPQCPVIQAVDPPFKICTDYHPMNSKGLVIIRPGEAVCYHIHYIKSQDIPGDITKQLIIKPFDGSEEVYIPLGDTAGHLPKGEVQKRAYTKIPDYAPDGVAVLKLSSSYMLGNKSPSHNVTYTGEFEIRR